VECNSVRTSRNGDCSNLASLSSEDSNHVVAWISSNDESSVLVEVHAIVTSSRTSRKESESVGGQGQDVDVASRHKEDLVMVQRIDGHSKSSVDSLTSKLSSDGNLSESVVGIKSKDSSGHLSVVQVTVGVVDEVAPRVWEGDWGG